MKKHKEIALSFMVALSVIGCGGGGGSNTSASSFGTSVSSAAMSSIEQSSVSSQTTISEYSSSSETSYTSLSSQSSNNESSKATLKSLDIILGKRIYVTFFDNRGNNLGVQLTQFRNFYETRELGEYVSNTADNLKCFDAEAINYQINADDKYLCIFETTDAYMATALDSLEDGKANGLLGVGTSEASALLSLIYGATEGSVTFSFEMSSSSTSSVSTQNSSSIASNYLIGDVEYLRNKTLKLYYKFDISSTVYDDSFYFSQTSQIKTLDDGTRLIVSERSGNYYLGCVGKESILVPSNDKDYYCMYTNSLGNTNAFYFSVSSSGLITGNYEHSSNTNDGLSIYSNPDGSVYGSIEYGRTAPSLHRSLDEVNNKAFIKNNNDIPDQSSSAYDTELEKSLLMFIGSMKNSNL